MKPVTLASILGSALASVPLTAGVLAGGGCADEIDRLTDCQDICARYADCYDDTYDVSACRSRCQDNAGDSASFDQRVDECENCFDDRSCTGAFACTTQCVGIVP